MSDNEDDTFEDTIEWASGGNDTYKREAKGIPVFYLILGAIVIIFLIILLIYLTGRNPPENKLNALTMMQNNDFVYDIDSPDNYRDADYDGDYRDGEDYRDADYRDGEDYRDGDNYQDGDYQDGDYRDGDYQDGDYQDGDYVDNTIINDSSKEQPVKIN